MTFKALVFGTGKHFDGLEMANIYNLLILFIFLNARVQVIKCQLSELFDSAEMTPFHILITTAVCSLCYDIIIDCLCDCWARVIVFLLDGVRQDLGALTQDYNQSQTPRGTTSHSDPYE